jgi:hypothetical protein
MALNLHLTYCSRCREDIQVNENRINVELIEKDGSYIKSRKKLKSFHEVCWLEIEDYIKFIDEHERYEEEVIK